MAHLKHAKVYRSGATAAQWNHETNYCTFTPNLAIGALEFTTQIASKGGGDTDVRIKIGLDDLPVILEELAKAIRRARKPQSGSSG